MSTGELTVRFSSRQYQGKPDMKRALLRSHIRQAEYAKADARRRVASHRKTGELDSSIDSKVLGGLGGWTLYATAKQAWFLEYGTGKYGPYRRPYYIYAKPGGALYWPGARHPVAKVLHPGIMSDPFMTPAMFDNADRWADIYAEEVRKEWVRG